MQSQVTRRHLLIVEVISRSSCCRIIIMFINSSIARRHLKYLRSLWAAAPVWAP
jgi:hypothetical protein